jgi:hypothetical protein
MTEISGAERRRFVRLPGGAFELQYRERKALRVLDISPGGVQFESAESLAIGSRLNVALSAAGFSGRTQLEVKRCDLVPFTRGAVVFHVGGAFAPVLGAAVELAARRSGVSPSGGAPVR